METVPSPVTLRHASIDIPKEGACHGEGLLVIQSKSAKVVEHAE